MADHSRLDLVVSGGISVSGTQGNADQHGEILAALKELLEFRDQAYPKLDFIISQNEQILANQTRDNTETQQKVNQLDAELSTATTDLEDSEKENK